MMDCRMLPLTIALLAALATTGCQPSSPTGKPPTPIPHEHPTAGPHGGALVEWGDEEYHVEFTVDRDKKQATAYILDDSAKKATPIATETVTLILEHVTPPVTVTLKADPMEGEAEGKSSRFVGTDDKLGEPGPFKGKVRGKVGETPYSGNFTEKK